MGKTINELTLENKLEKTDYLVKCNNDGNTTKVSFDTLTKNVISNIKKDDNVIAVVSDKSRYNTIYYNNMLYLQDGGSYTLSYTAQSNCIVFYHIEWDCNGNDGLKLQLMLDGNVVSEVPVASNFEGNNSRWLNTNGTVPLGKGMTMRFAPTQHPLNTGSGNCMTLLIATI